MSHSTPAEHRAQCVEKMGNDLGPVFHRLWNEVAHLHLKWNELLSLFAHSPARIRDLNTAAPGFFNQVQALWWEDLLLHLSRLTDNRPDVLSVYTIVKTAPVALRDELKQKLAVIKDVVAFARDARDRHIAHRNMDLALDRTTTPLTLGSRKDVRQALSAIDDLIHFIEGHFGGGPTAFDFVSQPSGVNALLDIVERGLKSRDEQYGYLRHPHPPDESE